MIKKDLLDLINGYKYLEFAVKSSVFKSTYSNGSLNCLIKIRSKSDSEIVINGKTTLVTDRDYTILIYKGQDFEIKSNRSFNIELFYFKSDIFFEFKNSIDKSSLKIESYNNFSYVNVFRSNNLFYSAINSLADSIMSLAKLNHINNYLDIQYILWDLLKLIEREFIYIGPNARTYNNEANKIMEILENKINNSEAITIEQLCDVLHTSKPTIIRKFKKYFGLPPLEFVRKKKMEIAMRRIKSTIVPISEIAYNLGYFNVTTFNRNFIDEYKHNPSYYRKEQEINMIQTIKKPGNTSLVELKNIENQFQLTNRIFAKVESNNPTGSIKDRTVFNMINEYTKKYGDLSKYTIVEATSGNTGISLAYYANIFKYKCKIVMPIDMSKQRREMIAKYGAELVLVEGGMKECNSKAEEIIKNTPNSFIFDQFNQKANYEAHFETGKEIIRDNKSTKYVFAGIGTGGTITGIASYFKNNNLDIKVIGIEPKESPLITMGKSGPHLIQGIGANFIPTILKLDILNDVISVSGLNSIKMAKTIRDTEKIDIGISSGAALLGAIEYIKDNNIKEDVVIIFPDKGDRYTW